MCESNGSKDERHAWRVAEVFLKDVGKIIAKSLRLCQRMIVAQLIVILTLIPDHWFIMYGPIPRITRCKLRVFVALLKTSPQVGSSSLLSASIASRISCSWPCTSSSSTGLSRSRLIVCLACMTRQLSSILDAIAHSANLPHQSCPSKPANVVSHTGTDTSRERSTRTESGMQQGSATAGSY